LAPGDSDTLSPGYAGSVTDSDGRTTTVSFNSMSHPTGEDESNGGSTSITDNSAGFPVSETDALGRTVMYDNAGNMILAKSGSSTTTYTYDFDNRLTGVDRNGTLIATYVYDAIGRRIRVDENGTQTWAVYDGTDPYADFNGSGALQVRYQYGPGVVDGAIVDQLLARTSSGGTTAWYLPDKLGSVRDIVSAAGTELDHIVYDSFGNIVTETDTANGDRFKYAGMQNDYAISYRTPRTSCHSCSRPARMQVLAGDLALARVFSCRRLVTLSPSAPWRIAA
jgi:YD repeat-containing protein